MLHAEEAEQKAVQDQESNAVANDCNLLHLGIGNSGNPLNEGNGYESQSAV